MHKVTDSDKDTWKTCNSNFSQNIVRKSNALMGDNSDRFQDNVVAKYIQIVKFLDQLRADHPNLHELIEDCARAQLANMEEDSILGTPLNNTFVHNIRESNKAAFAKHSQFMSDTNIQLLSFGYLSKWLAECYMDFV